MKFVASGGGKAAEGGKFQGCIGEWCKKWCEMMRGPVSGVRMAAEEKNSNSATESQLSAGEWRMGRAALG
jgi:hypothetical protein